MERVTRKIVSPVMTAAMIAALVVGAAPRASAMDVVPCDNSEFVKIDWHASYPAETGNVEECYANGGEIYRWGDPNDNSWSAGKDWVTSIWTGNNRVQWYGDGRWQPDGGINPWTSFGWSNHPGGVEIKGLRII